VALGNQQDFEMHSGNDRDLVVTVKNAAGVVVNITGATIKWQISKLDASLAVPTAGSDVALVSKDTGGDIAITDAVNGVFTVTIASADTESLKGDYYHESQVLLASKKSTVVFGKLTIKRNLIV